MRGSAYYNEHDPFAADWLRNLISAGHIAPGYVDERDIRDVRPDDLRNYTQHHFFAGIGVWSYALRRAGWPDDRPVATGSCPCQPFSTAGRGGGFDDERHLWPSFYHLIQECGFPVVLGEQVASKDGLAWIDLVQADMEGAGYSGGALDLCSAGFGAPHIRQRLYFAWLADTLSAGRPARGSLAGRGSTACSSSIGGVAHHHHQGLQGRGGVSERADQLPSGPPGLVECVADPDGRERIRLADGEGGQRNRQKARREQSDSSPQSCSEVGGVANTDLSGQHERAPGRQQSICFGYSSSSEAPAIRDPGPVNGFWRDADWLLCRNPDGEPAWRPVESGSFPLVDGIANRMGLLRGYGNAVNAEVTKGFVESVMVAIDALDVL